MSFSKLQKSILIKVDDVSLPYSIFTTYTMYNSFWHTLYFSNFPSFWCIFPPKMVDKTIFHPHTVIRDNSVTVEVKLAELPPLAVTRFAILASAASTRSGGGHSRQLGSRRISSSASCTITHSGSLSLHMLQLTTTVALEPALYVAAKQVKFYETRTERLRRHTLSQFAQ